MKSVKYIGGYFYNRRYAVIFVPLTAKQAKLYEDAVLSAETKKGAVLSDDELEAIAQSLDNDE